MAVQSRHLQPVPRHALSSAGVTQTPCRHGRRISASRDKEVEVSGGSTGPIPPCLMMLVPSPQATCLAPAAPLK